jgi:hypothetical protein
MLKLMILKNTSNKIRKHNKLWTTQVNLKLTTYKLQQI